MDLNGHFSKKDTQMADKHMNRCSISLTIWECNSKPGGTASPTRMVTIKTQKMTSTDEGVEKLEPLCSVGKKVRGAAVMDNSVVGLQAENGTTI